MKMLNRIWTQYWPLGYTSSYWLPSGLCTTLWVWPFFHFWIHFTINSLNIKSFHSLMPTRPLNPGYDWSLNGSCMMLIHNGESHLVRDFPLSTFLCHLRRHRMELSACPQQAKHLHTQVRSGLANSHQTCNSTSLWPAKMSIFISLTLTGVPSCCGGLKAATSVSYKNDCGQGCVWFKEKWKLYPETAFWETINGYKVNNLFSLWWEF